MVILRVKPVRQTLVGRLKRSKVPVARRGPAGCEIFGAPHASPE